MKYLITIGNPDGIGPEIVYKALNKLSPSQRNLFTIITDSYNDKIFFNKLNNNKILVDYEKYTHNYGRQTIESGYLSYLFLEKATELLKSNEYQGIATAPISKELIIKAGINDFLDHTDYFSRKFQCQNTTMFFYTKKLSVALSSIHIPLKDVSSFLNKDIIKLTMRNTINFLKRIKTIPKILVCGLNPHSGEKGFIGKEEILYITPAIEDIKKEYSYTIEGPIPPDIAFYKAIKENYNTVIAMYHDQGLIPLKLLYFDKAVNTTLGLPFIRTSPDHGTAFDIAGKNIADYHSMLEALKLLIKASNQ